jgi:hypothetical protein
MSAQPPQIVVVQGPPVSGWAVASLIFGIIGLAGGWCLFAIPCIVAVLCGHYALPDIRSGQKSGRGITYAGLIMGYLVAAPVLLVAVLGAIGNLAG